MARRKNAIMAQTTSTIAIQKDINVSQQPSSQQDTVPVSSTEKSPGSNRNVNTKRPREVPDVAPSNILGKTRASKRARTRRTTDTPDINELPHNLGSLHTPRPTSTGTPGLSTTSPQDPTVKLNGGVGLPTATAKDSRVTKSIQPCQRRMRESKNPYGLTPGTSPYPNWPHPTANECEEVNKLLSSIHGEVKAPEALPAPSLTVSGCGEVPSILDALIRTLLSGATTGANSAMAFQGLVQKFGILQEGIGKGSVDWNRVREAPVEEIYEAMKCGGLGASKSKYIKQILNMVYEDNMARRQALVNAREGKGLEPAGSANETEDEKDKEIAQADEHILSLNHMHALSKDEAMLQFVKYPGIGVKTAACVVLFCLQQPCMAVDTHVFRLCRWLGWVPPEKVNEITAFSHLEVRVPDHLKYSLHQLFIRHGKSCPRCRAITGENSEGWKDGCVIDHLVKRTGKRKGH